MPAKVEQPRPIRWVRYRVRNVRFGSQLRMLNLPSPAAAGPPGVPEEVVDLADPADLHPGVAPGEEIVLELPDPKTLPPVGELAVGLLQAAAKIEHALLVQYLYAAYSLTGDRKVVTGVAIEEMAHLLTVQNLLLLLGEPPHLGRQDFGLPDSDQERLFPFPLLFEPLSKASLAKYILAESPEAADAEEPAVMARVREAAHGQGESINRVGLLYAFLGVVFGDKALLMERAAEGDEWYQMVHRLAAILATIYGGRDRIHLPDAAFPAANPHAARQGPDEEWDHSVVNEALDEFRVFPRTAAEPLVRRGDALAALRDIGIQGEGSSTAGPAGVEVSHFARFLGAFKTYFGADGSGNTPVPTYRVPAGAVIAVGGEGPGAIAHPDTARWATLGNLRYALLLGFLEQYLVTPPGERRSLAAWTFAEMFHLKWLGAYLVTLPRSAEITAAEATAALPFTMPPDSELGEAAQAAAGTWPAVHARRLAEAVALAEGLLPTLGVNTDAWIVLNHMLQRDRRKLAEAAARREGKTVWARYDRVGDILDLAAGAGFPKHRGTSPLTGAGQVTQRRFWNLPLAHFQQVVVYGQAVLDPVDGAGSDAVLVDILKSGEMPQGRPAVAPEDIAFIDAWIRDGCPDAPDVPPNP